ncbi:MAG: response regulator transcription factor [Methylobacter sp.]|nr:response regulator transcription factor [Methylobacter sp.]
MNDTQNIEVLLLEDVELIRAGFRAILEKSMPTVNIHEAASYEQAVNILSSVNIDFAFLDIELKHPTNGLLRTDLLSDKKNDSDKTGLDVLNYIRSNELNVRSIMLSFHEDKELIMKCLDEGASGYIVKTINDKNVLQEALETVLQKNRVFLPLSIVAKENKPLLTNKLEDFHITPKEKEILYYICIGDLYKVIAGKMNPAISEGTARDYGASLYKKFKVKNKGQLIVRIAQLGIDIPKPKSDDRNQDE